MSRPSPVRDAVLKALTDFGPMTTPQVARAVKGDPSAVSSALQRLLRDGLVQVKRAKTKAVAIGMPKRPPNVWRLKPEACGERANVTSPDAANRGTLSA